MAITGLVAAFLGGGCGVLGGSAPTKLDYRVALTRDGIRVVLTVEAGPRPTAWVAFGASPLGDGVASHVVRNVEARTAEGAPLAVAPVGEAAYSVEIGRAARWTFQYEVRVGNSAAPSYHRSSSISPHHLLLNGVDVLARILDRPSDVTLPPAERPLGDVAEGTVAFDASSFPPGWQVVSAARERAPGEFTLADHPALSVFAVGPYRLHEIDRETGIRAAVHADWTVARDRVVNYSRQLSRVQIREFGPPPGDAALMIFTPLPATVRPREGVRTAGMVWDRSLVLFAGTAAATPQTNTAIREMMAVFLGHELFHLYVPWGLPVTQPLSWLSEGWSEHVGRDSARSAHILSASGAEHSLREAYRRYLEMGGARAGSLRAASEAGDEMRDLLYVRGELVFRILALEWRESHKQGSFDSVFWSRLRAAHDGVEPLEPEVVSNLLTTMVSPATVRRYVDGASVITLPELDLGRR